MASGPLLEMSARARVWPESIYGPLGLATDGARLYVIERGYQPVEMIPLQ
jgi:hypothetical protein